MPHFAVSAIGRDRPGIVAAITAALLDLDGNIEDSRMSILRGHFSVMLIVATEAGRETVADRLGRVREEVGLEALSVSEVDELDPVHPAPGHVLTVYGADHPGIVSAVSAALVQHDANITDLSTQLAGAPERPLYLLVVELALGGADPGELAAELERVGLEAGVEVSLRELETETL